MIVVCGEALMDVFVTQDTPAGVAMDARIGGSPLNVAIGLARLRQPVAFFGAVSRGVLGDRLMSALREEGVNTDSVPRLKAPTTLGLVALDASGVADYAFYGDAAADRLLPIDALADVPPAQAFNFGSYAMVVEPTASTLRALVEREHERSVIAYDPNVRLNVEPDLARWRDTLAWMASRCAILKVSDEDVRRLHPGASVDVLAASWLAAGALLVVVTRGELGCCGWTARDRIELPAPRVQVVDTVGAGDTFQAALLTALAEREALSRDALCTVQHETLQAALSFAVDAATITCSRRGADLPRRSELPDRNCNTGS
ncbi:MAG TPA: carbohydrate kinase [Burkholderiaceae bacterium]|nr:carbohydrate kinase [Burkholderiaceae bacterium]